MLLEELMSESAEDLFKRVYELKEYISKIKIDTNITVNKKDKQISAYGKSIKKSMGSYIIILDYKQDGIQVEVPLENMGIAKLKSIISKLEAEKKGE